MKILNGYAISRTISEIDKVKNENLELNDKLNIARAENERLKEENKQVNVLLQKACKEVEWVRNKYADNYSELKAECERLNNDKNKYYQMTLDDEIQISDLMQECEKLKRLLETKCQSEWEKENAELKEQLNKKDDLINDITNGGIQLQKECERLKEENEKLNKMTGIFSARLCEKYRQALQEIRDIAKEQLQDVSDRCINTTPMYIVHKHILAKINEVIGAEE